MEDFAPIMTMRFIKILLYLFGEDSQKYPYTNPCHHQTTLTAWHGKTAAGQTSATGTSNRGAPNHGVSGT